MNPRLLLRALAHRNFRLFFGGQFISLIGTWMQQVALSWVVYVMTGSAYWLGIVGFCGQIPSFFLAPVAGVLVDRWNRHRLLIATQTLMMIQALLLAWLDFSQLLTVWHILALSVFVGLVNAFDMTGRQAFLTQMVTNREDLANAVAINSSMVNGTRLIGPMLAGLLLRGTSAGVCFLVNGLSYLAVIAALLAMRVPPPVRSRQRTPLVQDLREGFRYVFGFPPIRAILLLLGLVSLTGMSYLVLLPIFAAEVLGGGEQYGAAYYSWLMSGAGVGALAGALFLAARKSVLGLGKWLVITPALFGSGLIGFSLARDLWLSIVLLAVAGFAMMVQMAASNTLLQTLTDEDKRGRVMSYYTMAFLGMAPLGSLLAGWLAQLLGAPAAVQIIGLCCIVGSVLFALQFSNLRAQVRHVYVRMGILPEVAVAIQEANELTVPPEGR